MIRSRRHPRILELIRLYRGRHRRLTGQTLLEGPHLLWEAVGAGAGVVEVFALPDDDQTQQMCRSQKIPLTAVTEDVLSRIASTKNPRGPVGVLNIRQQMPQDRDVLWLLVSDPGNCGTLIRTAAAFGWDVMMGTGSADPWSPKVLRAGAGGHFGVTIGAGQPAPPQALVLAAVARDGVPLPQLKSELDHDRPWWLVIGDESGGIPTAVAKQANVRCSIPTTGRVESLNAAAAGAILCHHLRRLRRNQAEGRGGTS